jgi:hypothetical protein
MAIEDKIKEFERLSKAADGGTAGLVPKDFDSPKDVACCVAMQYAINNVPELALEVRKARAAVKLLRQRVEKERDTIRDGLEDDQGVLPEHLKQYISQELLEVQAILEVTKEFLD